MGRDNHAPPHYRCSRTRQPRTRQQAHTKGASTQASKRGKRGGRSHTAPPPQTSAPTPRKRKHPKRTRAVAQTPNPNHPPSKHAHNKPKLPPPREHKSAHATARGQARCVSAGTRGSRGDRQEAKQAKPTRAGTQTAHTKARKQPWFAPCAACARQQGVSRERKAAHNSPRQSAWVVVFVGVFADVCRLFWLVGFGGLGVFWGCLACFLVF